MQRRSFIEAMGALAAGGALAGCAFRASEADHDGDDGARSPAMTASDYAARRRSISTGFGEVAYVAHGSGAAALFLHGYPLNGFQWRDAIARLAPHRRCIAPDFMGMGHTEVAEGQPVGPIDQMDMLVALLDALALPSVDVIASDSGGAVAQLLVVRHPARVRSLLLANCDTEIDSPPAALLPVIEMSRAGTFVDEVIVPQLRDKDFARSPEGIGGLCYSDPSHPTDDAIAMYFEPLVRSERTVRMAHAYGMALERNALVGIESSLRASRVPTRIVWGMDDNIFSADSPAYLERVLGNSRGLRRLEGRKLFWPEELAEVVAEEALALWEV